MSDIDDAVARYTTGNLRERVHAALRDAGHDPARLKPDDLNEGDHFHLGGRDTTDWIAGILGIGEGVRVLDVGSGLGGPARRFAVLGARVTGVDVTKEFTDLATELNQACGLEGSIEMLNRPGQQTGLEGSSFDVAVLMHVGMSIADKTSLFAEIFRLLRPGGRPGSL
ncbi:class I SAM-dependent methyltransferase [Glutamicibacter sp.]|uniref:class I SAM-dependent methyltransferase n=1 Tax=Glutamicibacter sp. TaxID=1931995 RepID=UPI0028BE3E8A|nr:class I SAM-dependent methyltransferase [Glutamicibacter sp.]